MAILGDFIGIILFIFIKTTPPQIYILLMQKFGKVVPKF